ncbi:MAG: hypothetical protein V4596_07655 [Bdellovibrionota bacterium]
MIKKFNISAIALFLAFNLIACGQSKTQNNVQTNSEGGERGNGADYHYIGENNPWFVDLHKNGNKVIKYCVELSPTFDFSHDQIKQLIEKSFNTWENYFKEKDLNEPALLVTKNKKLNSCDGTEDIAFYFGIKDERVKKYEYKFNESLGYSVRTENNNSDIWSKGFIWIASPGSIKPDYPNEDLFYPDWTLGNNLQGILIHELGHVYGISHAPGTIMSDDFFKLIDLRISYTPNESALENIDHTKELILDRKKIKKEGWLGYENTLTTMINGVTTVEHFENIKENFYMLFDRAPIGKISAQISGSGMDNLVLKVADEKSNATFPVLLKGKSQIYSKSFTESSSGIQIIQKTPNKHITNMIDYRSFTSEVTYATLQLKARQLDIIIERNLSSCTDKQSATAVNESSMIMVNCDESGPFNIKYFSNNNIKTLFRAGFILGFPH